MAQFKLLSEDQIGTNLTKLLEEDVKNIMEPMIEAQVDEFASKIDKMLRERLALRITAILDNSLMFERFGPDLRITIKHVYGDKS